VSDSIITAQSVLTMDPLRTRAAAVAVSDGVIKAVGSVEDCSAALPHAEREDLGDAVLLPGFIEPHSHPLVSGAATMPPAYDIAPWSASSWAEVEKVFRKAIAEAPAADTPLVFWGFDRLLHGADAPTSATLDPIFGDRMVVVLDNSGHGAFVTSAVIRHLGWDKEPPANPVGGSFGRTADGHLNGQGWEVAGQFPLSMPVIGAAIKDPVLSAARYYAEMARAGITSTSDMTFNSIDLPAYERLATTPGCPLRVSFYHMSTEADCGATLQSSVPEALLNKQGIKLWTDGSPWIGNIAISFRYQDTEAVRRGGISFEDGGTKELNYTRDQLDAILDAHVPEGWQMAFHVNGDIAFDVLLDAYERALDKYGLTGSDHRWRVEHLGAVRGDQMRRAGALGVVASMAPFQSYYWGDLLDGEMFTHDIGSRWQRFRDAFDAGMRPSFHNDGAVSPPTPLLNMQTAITRRTSSGTVRGPEQAVSTDEALQAHTVNAAYILRRDDVLGSIEPGKWADFVALSADPYEVDPATLSSAVAVFGTWRGGERIDPDGFVKTVQDAGPSGLSHPAPRGGCHPLHHHAHH
jgi:predicted amidohydrolase YtcJ